jgi:hypothetical protein
MTLKRITLDDLKPGMVFGYSFPAEPEGRRFCIAQCARVKHLKSQGRKTLFVSRARCIAPVHGDPKAMEWQNYNNGTQSGYCDAEGWEIYEYDEDALWAAHCAQVLTR